MVGVNEISFSFFGLHVVVQSDAPRYLDLFARLYPRAISAPRPASDFTFQILTGSRNLFGAPAVVIGDDVYPFLISPPRLDYIHSLVLEALQQRLTSHFVIDAGVVSRCG